MIRLVELNKEKALPYLYEVDLLHSSFVCSKVLISERIKPHYARLDPLKGVLNKEKALPRCPVATGFIIFILLHKQAFDGLKIIKPCCFRNKAFSL